MINSNKDDKVLEDIMLSLEKNTETVGLLGRHIKSMEANLGKEAGKKNEVEVEEINTRIKALEEEMPIRINDSIAENTGKRKEKKELNFLQH